MTPSVKCSSCGHINLYIYINCSKCGTGLHNTLTDILKWAKELKGSGHAPDSRPYKNYEKAKEIVLKRDNYTCQTCGYHPESEKIPINYCEKCLTEKGFLFRPFGDWRPPKPCEFHDTIKKCSECSYFKTFEYEEKSNNLLAHHIDNDPRHNHEDNLITVCRSCNNRLKVHSINEVRRMNIYTIIE